MNKQGLYQYSFRNTDSMHTSRLTPTPNAAEAAALTIDDSWEIVAKASDDRLTRYFTGDLCRFLSEAFAVDLRVRYVDSPAQALAQPVHKIFFFEAENVPDAPAFSAMQNAFYLTVTAETITVVGRSVRGTAQGAYYLEDQMKLRGEPSLCAEMQEHAPLFSPRLTHAGGEKETFPDSFLAECAHAGIDAIMVMTGHPETRAYGFPDPDPLWPGSGISYCDFNNLVWRAAGYGLDVYVYSMIKCDVHPRDAQAKAYYEASFGRIFRDCPGLKGIIFVGECFEFPSLDEHTCGIRCQLKPEGERRPSPGWYPCFDYPELLTMVRDTIFRYNPDADIVFWSYNWGYVDKDARLALIRALPEKITLLVTFDMWETFADEKGRKYRIDDYSISFEGPSQVYLDEAEEAARCGVRLYSMTNTGGRTWDNGVTPYLPVPQQWQKRYEQVRSSHDAHGLCGLMENHHYGWFPSFLTLFEKNAFMTNRRTDDDMLRRIALRDFGPEADKALKAWALFSEGIRRVIASNCDQYGPYRSGPTYPLLFDQTQEEIEPSYPAKPWASHRKFAIWSPKYPENIFDTPDFTLLRYERVQQVEDCFRRGLALLQEVAQALGDRGGEAAAQAAVAGFLHCTYVTAYHVMRWNIAKALLRLEKTGGTHPLADVYFDALGLADRSVQGLAAEMRRIAEAETENVSCALEAYHADSRIGFEASMEYVFDEEHAAWKNSVTRQSLEQLARFAEGVPGDVR